MFMLFYLLLFGLIIIEGTSVLGNSEEGWSG